MKYPTMDQVNAATHEQICRWYRFLPSPGSNATGTREFVEQVDREADVMRRIFVRLKEFGGFTPGISKRLG